MALESVPAGGFASTGEALDVMRSAGRFLAGTDYAHPVSTRSPPGTKDYARR
jgi:hypothetical protein